MPRPRVLPPEPTPVTAAHAATMQRVWAQMLECWPECQRAEVATGTLPVLALTAYLALWRDHQLTPAEDRAKRGSPKRVQHKARRLDNEPG